MTPGIIASASRKKSLSTLPCSPSHCYIDEDAKRKALEYALDSREKVLNTMPPFSPRVAETRTPKDAATETMWSQFVTSPETCWIQAGENPTTYLIASTPKPVVSAMTDSANFATQIFEGIRNPTEDEARSLRESFTAGYSKDFWKKQPEPQ